MDHAKRVQAARASRDPGRYRAAQDEHQSHIRQAHYPSASIPILSVQLVKRIDYGRSA
ncbi:hypothetical protein ACFY0G_37520 [Streptomyces sp. NPDC001552]|uniref:hypothetical protein n=1 Tax=Streptomyces sp. NPDC001552 TaxID=3364587 RepID=UPI0036A67965